MDNQIQAPAPLTAGELFTVILLVTCPCAVGQALANLLTLPAPTLADWTAELANTGEDPAIIQRLQQLLNDARYKDLFAAFLERYPTDGTPVNPASMMKETILRFGIDNASSLQPPWLHPPHPPGSDILRLMDILRDFKETAAGDQ